HDMCVGGAAVARTTPSGPRRRHEAGPPWGQQGGNAAPPPPPGSRESGAFQLQAVADSPPARVDFARCSAGTRIDHGGTRRSMRATGSNTWTLVGERVAKAHQASKYVPASAASSGQSSTTTPISFTCVIDFQSMLADPR